MPTTCINTLMSATADAVCGAPCGVRSPDRVNVRNGYRHRDFDAWAGALDVAILRLHSGSYFPTGCWNGGAEPTPLRSTQGEALPG